MSPGAVSERIHRLEAAGAIRGYSADVDPRAFGFTMEVIVGLQVTQGERIEGTISTLLEAPEVVDVAMVSGQWDLMIRALIRDNEHLRRFVLDVIWTTPGFRKSETMMVLESHGRRFGAGGVAGLAGHGKDGRLSGAVDSGD